MVDSKFIGSPCNNSNDIKNRQDLLKEIGNSDRLAFSIQALLMKFSLDLEKMLGILCRLELKQAVMQNSEQIITNFIEFSLLLKIIPEQSFKYFRHNFCVFLDFKILYMKTIYENFERFEKLLKLARTIFSFDTVIF